MNTQEMQDLCEMYEKVEQERINVEAIFVKEELDRIMEENK